MVFLCLVFSFIIQGSDQIDIVDSVSDVWVERGRSSGKLLCYLTIFLIVWWTLRCWDKVLSSSFIGFDSKSLTNDL